MSSDHEPTGAGFDPEGLKAKYTVTRNDGRDLPGQPHHGCFLFILDATHDPAARKALKVYADAVARTRPSLAGDLADQLVDLEMHHPIEDAPTPVQESVRRSAENVAGMDARTLGLARAAQIKKDGDRG